MEGRLIGQYRVTGALGEGGMGVVYAAEHTLLNRPAAVKVLLPRFSGEQAAVTRFFNEARAATAIQHPGIVEIYDFGWTSEGAAFIVMEHLRGETLSARHKRGPMRWSTALALTRQIAGALGAAHAKGIIHRDLKPDNVFLVPDPEVPGGERIKLLDFGIAKLAGALTTHHKTQTGALMGTPTYMAPEQCRGVAVDARADLYSLGCILFELCTGKPPFVGEGAGDVLGAHIYLPPPTMASLADGVPQEIEALVRRMLAKSPADRVQTAGEIIQVIDAAKSAIRRSGSQPVLAPVISFPDIETSDDHPEPEAESAPAEQELLLPRNTRNDAAGPALATQVQRRAAIPAAPAIAIGPQLDTTLSSAAGTRPRAETRAPARRSAVLGGVGGLAVLGVIAASFALFRGGEDRDAPSQSASSSPLTDSADSADSADSVVTPPALTATPPGPTVTPSEPEAAPPTATLPVPAETTVSAATEPENSPSSSPSGTSPPRAPTVRITIDSAPRDAVVKLDGDVVGHTPYVGAVERGDRSIKVMLRRGGYRDHMFLIRPDKAGAYKAALAKLPTARSSSATSSPPPEATPPSAPASPPPEATPPSAPASPPPEATPSSAPVPWPRRRGINPF